MAGNVSQIIQHVAAQLFRQMRSLDIEIVEPSDRHYYQPAWTLVGAGCMAFETTVKPEADCIPAGATWIQDTVTTFEPDENFLLTQNGKTIMAEFDYDGNPYPSFPLDQTQERASMWFLKHNVLSWVYWNRMLKGADHEGNLLRKLTRIG